MGFNSMALARCRLTVSLRNRSTGGNVSFLRTRRYCWSISSDTELHNVFSYDGLDKRKRTERRKEKEKKPPKLSKH
jgi:hypothetical protein